MRAPILLVFTFVPAVVLVVVSVLLKQRGRATRANQPTVVHRTADLSPAQEADKKGWWFGMLSPLMLIAGAAILLQLRWQTLPERFPIHWGINGQPDHWAGRNAGSVFGPLLIDLAVVAGLGLLGEVIARSSPGYEGRSTMVRTTRTILVICTWFVTILTCMISLLPLSRNPTNLVPMITMGATVFSLAIVGYVALRAFRMESIALAGQNSTEGRFWRAGLFYFNPEDSALMVPKRSGFGYTLNFGRPVCWLIFALLLAVPLVLPLLLFRVH